MDCFIIADATNFLSKHILITFAKMIQTIKDKEVSQAFLDGVSTIRIIWHRKIISKIWAHATHLAALIYICQR